MSAILGIESGAAAATAPFELSPTHIVTPKDFSRIKRLRAKLSNMGATDELSEKAMLARLLSGRAGSSVGTKASGGGGGSASASARAAKKAASAGAAAAAAAASSSGPDEEDDGAEAEEEGGGAAAAASSSSATATGAARKAKTSGEPSAKRRRKRGGRRLGNEDGTPYDDESDSEGGDEGNQLAMPGVSFAPAVTQVHVSELEADMTKKKRQAAERLANLLVRACPLSAPWLLLLVVPWYRASKNSSP